MTNTRVTSDPGTLAELWLGVLLGPTAALSQLEANYALVLHACQSGSELSLHLISAIAVVLTALGGLLAYRNWNPVETTESGELRRVLRTKFMSSVGMLISGLMLVVIIAQWIAILMFGPCHRWD